MRYSAVVASRSGLGPSCSRQKARRYCLAITHPVGARRPKATDREEELLAFQSSVISVLKVTDSCAGTADANGIESPQSLLVGSASLEEPVTFRLSRTRTR
jgi:hypothetical protein